jgi:uncharacterized membrane protein YdjX (TVP38/TMEM64 family)
MKFYLELFKKYFALGVIALVAFLFFYTHLYEYLSLHAIRDYHLLAKIWTHDHYRIAILIYILSFTILIACGIPCATIFSLIGGFLFGGIAVFYALFSMTVGGLGLFLAVRSAVGNRLTIKSKGWLKRMESGFKKDAFNYLLTMRLIAIFPCWISNIAAGFFNISIGTFLSATIIGLIPSTYIYVMAGRSLDRLSTAQSSFNAIILTPSIFLPLIGLAILSLLPVIYRRIR